MYAGDIQVRYAFLHGEDAGYQGMARYYQDYLVSRGRMTRLSPRDGAPPRRGTDGARPTTGRSLESQVR